VLTIGDSAPSPTAMFTAITDVKVAKNGRIYVAAGTTVKIFDSLGAYQSNFGRRGRGPGEYYFPGRLRISDNTIQIRELASRELHLFELSGTHIQTRPLAWGEGWTAEDFPLRGGALIIEQSPTPRPLERVGTPLTPYITVSRKGPTTRRLDTLFSIRSNVVYFVPKSAPERSIPMDPRFGAGGAWAIHGDSLVAHVDGYTGAVNFFAADSVGVMRPSRRAELGRTGAIITDDDMAAELERFAATKTTMNRGSLRVTVEAGPGTLVSPPARWSVATRAMFSTEGALWIGINRIVQTRMDSGIVVQSGEANTWTVFPPAGSATRPFTVDLPPLYTLTAVRGDLVYGYRYTNDGGLVVIVYRVVPAP
jgi:hypothetical protein